MIILKLYIKEKTIKILIIYLIVASVFFSCTPKDKEPDNRCRDCNIEERILKTYDNGQIKLTHHYQDCCGEKK